MDKSKRDKIIGVMEMVAKDVEGDAEDFDGKPFNGKTMATYMGNHGAAIKAVSDAIKEILADDSTPAPLKALDECKCEDKNTHYHLNHCCQTFSAPNSRRLSVDEIEKIILENILIKPPTVKKLAHAIFSAQPQESPEVKEEIIKKYYMDFLEYYYNSPCPGCPEGHESFWKTIIESDEWKEWSKIGQRDFPECEELGIMSKGHWEEFKKFIFSKEVKELKDANF